MLEAAFEFPAWWDRATRERKTQGGDSPCTHTSLPSCAFQITSSPDPRS